MESSIKGVESIKKNNRSPIFWILITLALIIDDFTVAAKRHLLMLHYLNERFASYFFFEPSIVSRINFCALLPSILGVSHVQINSRMHVSSSRIIRGCRNQFLIIRTHNERKWVVSMREIIYFLVQYFYNTDHISSVCLQYKLNTY